MKRMSMLGMIGVLVAAAWVAGAMAGFTGEASAQALLEPVQYVNPYSTLQQIQAAIDNGGTVFFEYGEYNQIKSPTPNVPNTGNGFYVGRNGHEVHIIGVAAPDGARPKINGGSISFRSPYPTNFKIENIEICNPDMAGPGLSYSRIGIMVLDALGTQVTINNCKITVNGNESDPGLAKNFSAGIWFRLGGNNPPPSGASVHITNNEIIGSKIRMGIGLGHFFAESPDLTAPRFLVDHNTVRLSDLRGLSDLKGAPLADAGIMTHGNLSNAVITNNLITGSGGSQGFKVSAMAFWDSVDSQNVLRLSENITVSDNDSSSFTGEYQIYAGTNLTSSYIGHNTLGPASATGIYVAGSEDNQIVGNTLADNGIALGAGAPPSTNNAGSQVWCNTATSILVSYAHGPVIIGGNQTLASAPLMPTISNADKVTNLTGVQYTGPTEIMAVVPVSVNLSAQLAYNVGTGSDALVTFNVNGTPWSATSADGGAASRTITLGPAFYTIVTSVGKGSCAFTVTDTLGIGPGYVEKNVLAELTALRATVTDKHDADKLDEAIEHLTNVLDPNLWLDPTHVAPKRGEKVFQEGKDTVTKLRDLMKDKKSAIADDKLQGFISRIIGADNGLAQAAINDALAAKGDAKKIAKANEELAKGDREAADGKYEPAIEHYRNAWKHALEAM